MPEKEAESLQREMADDIMAFCIVEDNHDNITSRPPTKLKNCKLFKPFEMFVDMYGLPSYNELDPTVLIGLSYSILFGFMFGDVGQGLCLMIGGWLLYHFKKMNLAGICRQLKYRIRGCHRPWYADHPSDHGLKHLQQRERAQYRKDLV